jgi:hypothetical protein
MNSVKGKSKVHLRKGHEGPEGEQRNSSTVSLNSALDEGGLSTPRPGPLYPRECPGTRCIGGWVGARAGLNGCGKISQPPGFDPRTVQPVVRRYTDCRDQARHKHTYLLTPWSTVLLKKLTGFQPVKKCPAFYGN